MTNREKLGKLREAMKAGGIDACIIPSGDPHLGENVPEHWRIINWLTGFSGSAATVVVTNDFAGLWTDSRYFLQAVDQLAGSGFQLMKPSPGNQGGFMEWLPENIESGSLVSLDGRLFSVSRYRKLENLPWRKNIVIRDIDLISCLWEGRPELQRIPAYDHPVSFCGKDRSVKIAEVRQLMVAMGVDYHLLTSPDDIMWLLNIRGGDAKYSPLLTSFALAGRDQILLFTDEELIPPALARQFDTLGIVILPYSETEEIVKNVISGSSLLIDPVSTSSKIYSALKPVASIKEDISIPARLKSVKNKTEIENIERAMIKDGVALTRFFIWFFNNKADEEITEMLISRKLHQFRSEQADYAGPSFQAIAAFNAHAALPHYSATEGTNAGIMNDGILLIDSGGQYTDGTTDITRTIATGRATQKQKRDFTLVLKGMIALADAKFPYGTKGYQIDALARKPLWESGLNYGHGTGHGVGFFLNVHEGPPGISPAASERSIVLEPGMVISDEPALYREGEYGIRTENLLLCYQDEETEFGRFLRFETLSLCFIDRSLIDMSLLDRREVNWLNSYHAVVYDRIGPFLTAEEREWLGVVTAPLPLT